MDKKLQKSVLSFFEIMLQFCSVDPGSEKELDSGLCLATFGQIVLVDISFRPSFRSTFKHLYCIQTCSDGHLGQERYTENFSYDLLLAL